MLCVHKHTLVNHSSDSIQFSMQQTKHEVNFDIQSDQVGHEREFLIYTFLHSTKIVHFKSTIKGEFTIYPTNSLR